MNPQQTQQLIRSVLLAVFSSVGTLLVTKGILTADQANALLPEAATVVMGLGGALVVYLGNKSHSASAVVAAVNSSSVPGVKVVDQSSPSPAVAVTSTGAVTTIPAGSKS